MEAIKPLVHEDSSGRRVYETGGRKYPSVTTILSDAYPKPQLMGWGSKMAAQAALEGGHEGMSEREALTFLQRAPYRYMRMRGNNGTKVHEHLEKILAPVVDGSKPVWWTDGVIDGYVSAARAFCEKHLLGVLAVECQVFSDRFGYAGTVDMVARSKSGKVVIVDWKTSKSLYPDNALQLAAYAAADWMIDGKGVVRKMSTPGAAAVVRLEPSGGYEAGFLSRASLIRHHETFVKVMDIKHFLESANETWSKQEKGGAAK